MYVFGFGKRKRAKMRADTTSLRNFGSSLKREVRLFGETVGAG